MRKVYFILFLISLGGCFSTIKKTDSEIADVEIIEVKGTSIVSNSKEEARKLALLDAFKNAVDSVVGVYISANSLVSKSFLIDEEIRANTQGYIKRYEILKEYEENGFYFVTIRAYVKKDDIAVKASKIENEVEKIGSPIVALQVNDLKRPDLKLSENFLIGELKKDYFRISKTTSDADVVIYAEIDTYFNTSEGIGGFFSYFCNINGKLYTANDELVGGFSQNSSGIGLSEEDARNNASINCVKKSYPLVKEYIITFFSSKRILGFEIDNVTSISDLNAILRFFKNIAQVRNVYVKTYSNNKARIEVVVHKGSWQEIYPIIARSDLFEIKNFSNYNIFAVKK